MGRRQKGCSAKLDRSTCVCKKSSGELTFKSKVCEEGNVFSALLTFGELAEHEKSPPAATIASHSDTLDTHSERVKIALSDTPGANRTNGAHPSVDQESERDDDTNGEDPSRYLKRDCRLDLARPSGEGKKIDGGKSVDSVDGYGDDKEDVEKEVRERG